MELSVVVPTLNGRERLGRCLDALAEHAPDAEVVVVNGPSTDGTTGMVRSRDDVDVLLELPERNVNVSRNAGIATATGDAVALLDDGTRVSDRWQSAVDEALSAGADAVTGPRHHTDGATPDQAEVERLGGREVTYFDGGNTAFATPALDAIDGFDEYLQTGGARDAAQRLSGQGRRVEWGPEMRVRHDLETDGGGTIRSDAPRPTVDESDLERDWGWKYRSYAYRLTKNYGPRPGVVYRVGRQAVGDAVAQGTDVFRGDSLLSTWAGAGRTVVGGIARGGFDGLRARYRDRTDQRNPNGLRSRTERAVATYDWR